MCACMFNEVLGNMDVKRRKQLNVMELWGCIVSLVTLPGGLLSLSRLL